MTHLHQLRQALTEAEARVTTIQTRLETLIATAQGQEAERTILTETDAALRALLQSQTDETFRDTETLLLRGLQTVFGPEWGQVHITCTQKHGRLWADLRLSKEDGVGGPPLDTYGGGPASLVAFLLRMLVIRRLKLAPVILLDETFAQVSVDYVPALAQFLRLLVEKLGFTILLVTHQPAFVDAAHRVYRVKHDGAQAVFTEGF